MPAWLTGEAFKLFFGGALKRVVGFLRAHSIWLTISLILLACWGVDHVISHRHAAKVESQLGKCTKGRADDRAAYIKAQADAAAKNAADVAADKAARERITNDISQSYEAQLASLRADLAKRLRQNAAPQGASGSSGLPNVSPAPSGPDAGSRVSIPSGLYVRGAELELQLEQLQHWVSEQLKINPNKP
jgi:predicted RNA-binding protein YlxR (DUF448 family)